jgi:hypothetical protein
LCFSSSVFSAGGRCVATLYMLIAASAKKGVEKTKTPQNGP